MHHIRHKLIGAPKIAFIGILLLIAALLASQPTLRSVIDFIAPLGYLGSFLAGIIYAYSALTPASIALLLLLAPTQYFPLTIFAAAMGAMVGDLIVFYFVRTTLSHELDWLAKTKVVRRIWAHVPPRWRPWLLPVIGAALIASPLPDEVGVALLAASTNIPTRIFVPLMIILNGIGITGIVATEMLILHIFSAFGTL